MVGRILVVAALVLIALVPGTLALERAILNPATQSEELHEDHVEREFRRTAYRRTPPPEGLFVEPCARRSEPPPPPLLLASVAPPRPVPTLSIRLLR